MERYAPAQFAATAEVSEDCGRLRWPCRTRPAGRLPSWPKADEIVSTKSASSCRSAGIRAARGMIGLVGSRAWSAMYHTNPAYLRFVYWSLSNSTSSGRGVFGSAIFACGRLYRRQTTAVCHVRTVRQKSTPPLGCGWTIPYLGPWSRRSGERSLLYLGPGWLSPI